LCEVYCETDIEENIENLNTRLISRGYPEQMVEKNLREVKYKDRKEALKQKSKIAEGTTFVSGNFTQPSIPNFGKHNHAQMALLNTNTQRYIQGATLDLLWKRKITEIRACKSKIKALNNTVAT